MHCLCLQMARECNEIGPRHLSHYLHYLNLNHKYGTRLLAECPALVEFHKTCLLRLTVLLNVH